MEKYRVCSYQHEAQKLFHIGFFLMETPTRETNRNYQFSVIKGKAKWIKNNIDTETANVVFSNTFMLFVLNTDDNWEVQVLFENVSADEAIEIKRAKNEEMITLGYRVTGHIRVASRHADVPVGIYRSKKFTSDNVTWHGFKKWCEKAIIGMNITPKDFMFVAKTAYGLIVDKDKLGEMARGQIWLMFKEHDNG